MSSILVSFFTRPKCDDILYVVTVHPSDKFTANCTCLNKSILYKHMILYKRMLLVSRTHSIPYHDPSITARHKDPLLLESITRGIKSITSKVESSRYP